MMDLSTLKAPHSVNDLEWRVGRTGSTNRGPWVQVLAYQTARAVMNRFDAVCGPENWQNRFQSAPEGGVLCGIGVRTEEGEWVWKWDGAENTDVEAVKGGLSDSMKRAAVQWGCGRYLYGLKESFGIIHEYARHTAGKKEDRFRWNPPPLPAWAIPPEEPDHETLLAFIKEGYKEANQHTVKLGGAWVSLPEFVPKEGQLLTEDYYLAWDVAEGISTQLGVPFPTRPKQE